jgi:hypothetical protein
MLVAVAMLFTIVSLGTWLSTFLTFWAPLLRFPGYSACNVLAFAYGAWLAVAGALVWSLFQVRSQASGPNRRWARRIILIGASLPPLGALALGLRNAVSMAVASAGGAYFNDQARNIALGQLSAALPLLVTLPLLARERQRAGAAGSRLALRFPRGLASQCAARGVSCRSRLSFALYLLVGARHASPGHAWHERPHGTLRYADPTRDGTILGSAWWQGHRRAMARYYK